MLVDVQEYASGEQNASSSFSNTVWTTTKTGLEQLQATSTLLRSHSIMVASDKCSALLQRRNSEGCSRTISSPGLLGAAEVLRAPVASARVHDTAGSLASTSSSHAPQPDADRLSPNPSPIPSVRLGAAVRQHSQISPTSAGARKTNRCNAKFHEGDSLCGASAKRYTFLPRSSTRLDPAPGFDLDSIVDEAISVGPHPPLLKEPDASSDACRHHSSEVLEGICVDEELPIRCLGRDSNSSRLSEDCRKERGAAAYVVNRSCTASFETVPRDSARLAIKEGKRNGNRSPDELRT
jgi:hypothetical protein